MDETLEIFVSQIHPYHPLTEQISQHFRASDHFRGEKVTSKHCQVSFSMLICQFELAVRFSSKEKAQRPR